MAVARSHMIFPGLPNQDNFRNWFSRTSANWLEPAIGFTLGVGFASLVNETTTDWVVDLGGTVGRHLDRISRAASNSAVIIHFHSVILCPQWTEIKNSSQDKLLISLHLQIYLSPHQTIHFSTKGLGGWGSAALQKKRGLCIEALNPSSQPPGLTKATNRRCRQRWRCCCKSPRSCLDEIAKEPLPVF